MERVETVVHEQEVARSDVEQEIQRGGKVTRVRHRDRFSRLEQELQDLLSSQARLENVVGALRASEKAVLEEAAVRDRWLLEHAPQIKRFDALTRELWRREQQQAIAAEVAMPAYLVNAVGERLQRPSERATWHEAVRAVEAYRQRWNVTHTIEALGTQARSARQGEEREAVERVIERLRSGGIERDIDDGGRGIAL